MSGAEAEAANQSPPAAAARGTTRRWRLGMEARRLGQVCWRGAWGREDVDWGFVGGSVRMVQGVFGTEHFFILEVAVGAVVSIARLSRWSCLQTKGALRRSKGL